MIKKKDNIIYKTTNLVNEKIYVGQDSKNNPKYIGSGKPYFENAVNKYGKENFRKEILEHCSNIDELNEREIYWIKELDAMNPKVGYNLNEGGGGNLGFHHSKETKRKIGLSSKGRKPSKKSKLKNRDSNLGQTRSEETKRKISENNGRGMKGKHHSEESKQKLRDANLRKKLSEEHKQKISNALKGHISWYKGKTLSEEHKRKISNSLKGHISWNKGKTLSKEHKQKISNSLKGRHHTEETKRKLSLANKGQISINKIKISKEELYHLYITQDKNQPEIAKIFKCHKETIHRRLKEYNIKK